MKIKIDKSFEKDISKINDKNTLLKVKDFILKIENAKSINEFANIKKLKGYDSFYR